MLLSLQPIQNHPLYISENLIIFQVSAMLNKLKHRHDYSELILGAK